MSEIPQRSRPILCGFVGAVLAVVFVTLLLLILRKCPPEPVPAAAPLPAPGATRST